MWLGSGVAVAVVWAGSYSSDSTPSLGTSICRGCSPKKTKKKKKEKPNKKTTPLYWISGIGLWIGFSAFLAGRFKFIHLPLPHIVAKD